MQIKQHFLMSSAMSFVLPKRKKEKVGDENENNKK